jgi:hypothetical protein
MERTSIRSRVGRYRGLSLQVQAHPLFAPKILLCLPGGGYLDELHARSDAGLFASADSLIRSLPERRCDVAESIHTKQQRIVEIDAELERLVVWEGQAAYEAAAKELADITAAFAAQEEAGAEHAAAPSTNSTTDAETDLSAETIAAVQALAAEADEQEAPISIPPAVASLAYMEATLRRQAVDNRTAAPPDAIEAEMVDGVVPREEDDAVPTPTTMIPSSHHRPTAQPRLVFGQPLAAAIPRHRSAKACEQAQGQQLNILSVLGAPTTHPTAQSAQDHDLAEPQDLEQRSLFG